MTAIGIRGSAAVGDFMIFDTVRPCGECAVATRESRVDRWRRQAMAPQGMAASPVD